MPSAFLPAVTSLFALVFAIALLDQWRERRYGFQLIWAIGMLFFAIAAGCEAIAAAAGWNEALYRTWYLTGAVWTAGWLGLGTAYLLGRTRFGYTFAFALLVAGVLTLLTQRRFDYPGAGSAADPVPHRRDRPRDRRRGRDVLPERALADARGRGRRRRHDRVARPDGPHAAGRARATRSIRGRAPTGDAVPRHDPPPDAVPEHHRVDRARPRRGLLDVRVHAQAARPAVFPRPEPAGRPVPVQPAASPRSRSP